MTEIEETKQSINILESLLRDWGERLKGKMHYDNVDWFVNNVKGHIKRLKDYYIKLLENDPKEV